MWKRSRDFLCGTDKRMGRIKESTHEQITSLGKEKAVIQVIEGKHELNSQEKFRDKKGDPGKLQESECS